MLLSTVIVSYNTKELLLDCLKSVEKSTKNIPSEIFVVDNNSHDKTAEAVVKNFPNVIVIANKTNIGFSKANNLAIKRAKGKYLLILNPDTKLEDDTCDKMVEFMQENTDVGISTCRIKLENGKLDRDCRRHFPTPWKAFSHFSNLSKLFKGSKLFDGYYYGYLSENKEHEVEACVGAFMLIHRNSMVSVGLFDEDFFFYGEDLDLCWRFHKKGFKIFYTPRTKITHYKGASSGIKAPSMHLSKATITSKKRAVRESTRAMELFYKKHYYNIYPKPLTWLVITSVKILEKYRLFKVKWNL